jgi:uncharacterized protein DUF3738
MGSPFHSPTFRSTGILACVPDHIGKVHWTPEGEKAAPPKKTEYYRNIMHRTTATALVVAGLMNAGLALSQAPATIPSDLKFEVASLKPSEPGGRGSGIRPAAGGQRYEATNCLVKEMIQVAYRVKAEQILGGPAWLNTDRFDMKAKAERQFNLDELHVMLMNLLVERFQLRFHQEKKELPMYALTVDKGGAKVTPHGGRAVDRSDHRQDCTCEDEGHVRFH